MLEPSPGITQWNKTQEGFFDRFSDQFGVFNFGTESVSSREASYRFLELLNLKSGARSLEFGCGRGEWIIRLAEKGYFIDGLDLSANSVGKLSEYLKDKGLDKKASLFIGDVQLGDIKNIVPGPYSTVFCYNLLHHVLDIDQVVANMVAVTEKGGVVIAYEPNPWHFWWYLCPLFNHNFRWSVEKGLLRTNPVRLKNIFLECGLKKVEIIPWDFFPMISPEKSFRVTEIVQRHLQYNKLFKYLSAVFVIRGYKL